MLANVVRKPLRQIFSEFAGVGPQGEGQEYFGTGDVKYHLGTSYDRPTTSGKRVHLSLLANPSHLEARACPLLRAACAAYLTSSAANQCNQEACVQQHTHMSMQTCGRAECTMCAPSFGRLP